MSSETILLTKCIGCTGTHIDRMSGSQDLWKCADCELVFVNPQPTLERIGTFYSSKDKYKNWISDTDARDRLWKRRIDKIVRHRRGGSLLDVGTGTGQFLHHARDYFDSVDGTELSLSGIETARERYDLVLRHGDLQAIDIAEHFDNISLFHLLEHVHQPRDLLLKCHALLNNNGHIFIAVPNDLDNLRLKLKTRIKRLRGDTSGNHHGIPPVVLDGSVEEIHLTQFTAGSLSRLLEATGFSTVEMSLDPFYVANGLAEIRRGLEFTAARLIEQLTGRNIYDTIWAVARKR